MITQRCPKCRSNRIRRGYRHTSVISKLIFRYNLLCDGCNWEFSGFAFPFEIDSDPKKQTLQEKAPTGINRANEYWSESVARDSQSNANQYAAAESASNSAQVKKAATDREPAGRPAGSGGSKQKAQRSKRSKKRDEKKKKASTTVRSRSSPDDISRKRTSPPLEKKESEKDPAIEEKGSLKVRNRVVAGKPKTATGTTVGGQSVRPKGSPAGSRSKPNASKRSIAAAAGSNSRPSPSPQIVADEKKAEEKPTKVVQSSAKRKPAIKKLTTKKPGKKPVS